MCVTVYTSITDNTASVRVFYCSGMFLHQSMCYCEYHCQWVNVGLSLHNCSWLYPSQYQCQYYWLFLYQCMPVSVPQSACQCPHKCNWLYQAWLRGLPSACAGTEQAMHCTSATVKSYCHVSVAAIIVRWWVCCNLKTGSRFETIIHIL